MDPVFRLMAQAVLNLFPDCVSQFGLVGCFTVSVPFALLAYGLWTAFRPMPRRAAYRYDRVTMPRGRN